jgi:glycosyltransferase involved in cell wall biosynthesis
MRDRFISTPTLEDLPPPPPGKTGWPWTEADEILSERFTENIEWPCISIVTPNYNYGQFLEETIRSVLLQGYPKLEYIVIDGGSTDHSLEVIKKYEAFLSCWLSEPDEGQSDALNKGFRLSHGEVCAYINSDDIFMPGAFQKIAEYLINNPSYQWVASTVLHGESIETSHPWRAYPGTLQLFAVNQTFAQQGVFWRSHAHPKPYFDISKNYLLDHKFFLALYIKHGVPGTLDYCCAFFRNQPDAKSAKHLAGFEAEHSKVLAEARPLLDPRTIWKIRQEQHRKLYVYQTRQILETPVSTLDERLKLILYVFKLFRLSPFPLRDRTFISALLRLLLPNLQLSQWKSRSTKMRVNS